MERSTQQQHAMVRFLEQSISRTKLKPAITGVANSSTTKWQKLWFMDGSNISSFQHSTTFSGRWAARRYAFRQRIAITQTCGQHRMDNWSQHRRDDVGNNPTIELRFWRVQELVSQAFDDGKTNIFRHDEGFRQELPSLFQRISTRWKHGCHSHSMEWKTSASISNR